jgi:hypothetical protein
VRTQATFRLYGDADELTADAVTRQLGIQPTLSGEAVTRVGRRSKAIRAESIWILNSGPEIEEGVELADQLERLLAVLEPLGATLWNPVESGYEANWYCSIESHATEHAAEINRHLMQRLRRRRGNLQCRDCAGRGYHEPGRRRQHQPDSEIDVW